MWKCLLFLVISTSLFASKNFNYIAFFLNDTSQDLKSFYHHVGQVDTLMPIWLKLNEGNIEQVDPLSESIVLHQMRMNYKYVEIVPVVSNHDGTRWRSDFVDQVINDQDLQNGLIESMIAYLDHNQLTMLNLDFEDIATESLESYYDFLAKVADEFHKHNLKLAICVDSDPKWDFERVGQIVDLVILMLYDEHGLHTSPGPIASLKWFRDTFLKYYKSIPAQKLIVGLGNYGYDWKEGKNAKSLTVSEVLKIAANTHAHVHIDPKSKNPTFTYRDKANKEHEVWFLNAKTLYDQLQFLKGYPTKGVSLWRLGSEDEAIWNFYGTSLKF